MAVSRWMDQCDHPGIDRAVLFRDRRLGDQIPDRVYQGKWKNAGGRRIFFGVYLRWSIHGTLFYPVLSVHSDDHLRRGAKRNRTCIEIYDADTDRVIRPDCGVFRDKTGRHGGSKIFSCAKCEKLFLDDGGSGDGTDVLFAVDCNGNPHYLWILYEKETSLEDSTRNVEVFDTAIAIMAGLMIIPAVFAFSGGDPDTLQAGPALMFITIPKVFENMGFGTVVGILFFLLVLFAAVTSSIALTESAVSTFEDELGWSRRRATVLVGVIMIALGSLSSLGYGPLAGIKIIGMQFLDFFDFLTNSVMMPIAAMLTSLFVSRIVGMKRMEEEIMHGESTFRRKKIFIVMIKYLCPVFALIILISSVANAFGWIAM